MSDQSQKSRFAIDLDDLERQLRSSPAQDVRQPVADPFAELARLVGQDDPYKDMFRQSEAPVPSSVPAQRQEPVFTGYSQAKATESAPDYSVPQDDLRGALDEFDAIFDRQGQHAAVADNQISGMPAEEPVVYAQDATAPVAGETHYQAAHYEPAPVDPMAAFDDMISRDLDHILQEGRPQNARAHEVHAPEAQHYQ